ncbi:cardiolipin synthase [Pseudalkalibacillus caeni]|uniref:Cardiolipin synthase n=2 Tax=Exobacillus caeni TaxID=2574798 RepID=A0A5R9F516_9BACL|nr:cardiolipin synthase [Pseudalkalibacillus caeni]
MEQIEPSRLPVRHSSCSFYNEGRDFFSVLFDDIENAQKHIHLLFYIFRDDTIGMELIQRLIKKSSEGVKVRVLIDAIGSHKLSKSARKLLKENNIELGLSNRPKFPFFFYTLNHRNHRKIGVIDGNIGYIGGFNIGDEYLGKDPKLGYWRDYQLRINGDGVQDLQQQFVEDWRIAGMSITKDRSLYPELEKGPISLKLEPTEGIDMNYSFLDYIESAEKSIVVGTPYYIPGLKIQNALITAARKKINVKIILPFKADHPLVKEAAFRYFLPLLEAGCEIYQYQKGFYHAKVLLIDDELCDIGTANFDKRSFHINSEINCILKDGKLLEVIKKTIEQDIKDSERLTIGKFKGRPILQRLKEPFADLLSYFL